MKKNIMDWIYVAVASILILSVSISLPFTSAEGIAERENRYPASLKPLNIQSLLDGSFFTSVSNFYSDRVPLRPQLAALATLCELAIGKRESGGIIFGSDGYLIPKGEYSSPSVAQRNFNFISELYGSAEARGLPMTVCLLPRSIDINGERLPSFYKGRYNDIWQTAENSGIDFITPTAPLRQASSKGEYVWFKTDHHYTARGAYITYITLGASMGYSPYTEDFFSVQVVSEDFLGTSHSKNGGVAFDSDRVELYRYSEDEAFTVTVTESGEERRGFYDFKALDKKDKYLIFLGGNYAHLTVSLGKDRERLLIFKDSYANALLPLLSLHYDITAVDPRYFSGDISPLFEEADRVLVLMGIDTLATTALK